LHLLRVSGVVGGQCEWQDWLVRQQSAQDREGGGIGVPLGPKRLRKIRQERRNVVGLMGHVNETMQNVDKWEKKRKKKTTTTTKE
jgi:hypothetical protein